MYERCSVCQIQYEREHGFFLTAIFFGYVLYALLLAPISLYFYFTERMMQAITPLAIVTILLAPFVFRTARVLWLHVDEALDPRRDMENGEENHGKDHGKDHSKDHSKDSVEM